MNIQLVKLSTKYKKQLFDMMEEWLAVEQDFSPYAIRKNDYRDFDYYLENLEVKEATETLVPDSTFFCLDIDRDIFVGAVNIRHYLGSNNCHTGGHIGDGIRPSERRKGYATAMIGLALLECQKLGMHKVLMTCDADNIGSAKSIMNNGGILEREILEDGVLEQRYWISLEEEHIESERLILKRRMPIDAYDAFDAWASDERNMTYMMGSAFNHVEELLEVFDSYDPNSTTRYIMMARSKEDGHAIGIVAANRESERDGYELSWMVAYDEQNKGYCTEMAKALMQYFHENKGIDSFWSECADENLSSCAVMKKLGFKPLEKSSYSKKDKSRTFSSTVYALNLKMIHYCIADLVVATNESKYLSDNFKAFICEAPIERPTDITIFFDSNARKMYELMQNTVNEKLIIHTSFMSIYEASDHFTLVTYNDRKYVGVHLSKNYFTGIIYTNDSQVPRGANCAENELNLSEKDLYQNAFREAFMFYAQRLGRIAIHSSSFCYREKGWLFSGSTGAGKTTHVSIWKSAGLPICMIDGDIAMIHRKDNQFVVSGLPWCGTSEEYSTICVPLGGIYFLKKDSKDFVEELPYVDQVLRVNAECLMPNWKREMMSMTLDAAEALCKEIDVCELHCTMEQTAAFVMQNHIDGILNGEIL